VGGHPTSREILYDFSDVFGWSGLLELERAGLLVVGTYKEIVVPPALDHIGSFGLDNRVDASDLAADLPGHLDEKRSFVRVYALHYALRVSDYDKTSHILNVK
jgi:hypothetical protein